MARRTETRVEGLRELEDALIDIGQTIGPTRGRTALRQGMQDSLKPMLEDAKGRVRVDKGQLKGSLRIGGVLNRPQKKQHRKESDIEVHMGPSGVPQAITEEFGTTDQEPHPYMRPAYDANAQGTVDSLAKNTWARIEKAAKAHARRTARLAR